MQTNFIGNIIPMIGYMYIYSMVYIYMAAAKVHGFFTDGQLPPGFRFVPTDEELVKHYLRKKELSIPLPGPVLFHDVDATNLYSTHPKCLVKFLDGEREWFFFFHEDEDSRERILRRSRKARVLVENGGGFWKPWQEKDPICNEDGHIIAWKTDLTYFSVATNSKAKKTHWTMQQYRIVLPHVVGSCISSSTVEKNSQRDQGIWVLCRLRRGREYVSSF
ncbi:hypothetical protein CIPAW_11G051300 [Carya illinoinensis]|uniref:NAC domain-containing protein n=2 Tax=Carya illinoinensis TaxID=32201 RepID=A0A8T1P2I4_CARIL|nr:hypothetical protein CIPAW_11G051300 [Carya illinoinensis]